MSTINNSDPILQRLQLKPEQLIQVGSVSTSAAVSATYRIRVPDSRLLVKASILFQSTDPANTFPNDLSGMTPALWSYAADQDDSGVLGGDVPVTNLIGTQAIPLTVPLTTGLRGISIETKGTLANYIEGVFSAKSNSALRGIWYLSVTIQPLNVTLPAPVWERICNLFNVSNTTAFVGLT